MTPQWHGVLCKACVVHCLLLISNLCPIRKYHHKWLEKGSEWLRKEPFIVIGSDNWGDAVTTDILSWGWGSTEHGISPRHGNFPARGVCSRKPKAVLLLYWTGTGCWTGSCKSLINFNNNLRNWTKHSFVCSGNIFWCFLLENVNLQTSWSLSWHPRFPCC